MINIDINKISVVGFDLDDTLHHFKKASGAASLATLTYIGNHFKIPLETLQSDYSAILKNMQLGHFTINQPSREYRKRRFEQLLQKHQITPEKYIDNILQHYNENLHKNLILTTGANDTLKTIKSQNKKIIIITEGPQDAQETTIQRLRISQYIDEIFTSSFHETSKTERLFDIALQHLKCTPQQLLFIGDNYERDIVPPRNRGIQTIHINTTGNTENESNSIACLSEFNHFLQEFT